MAVLSRLRIAAQPIMSQLSATSRAYASAAAAIDYDYYDYYDEVKSNKTTMEESEGWVPGRGVQWVIIGDDPMGKRHVYADRLSKLLDVPHISMGALVRQELHPRSSLYKQIASAVNEGKVVPEDVIFGLLSKRLEEGYSRGETGFILDGIPRTTVQAEILDQIAEIDLVVNLKCTEECLCKKHSGIHSSMYNVGQIKSSHTDLHTIWKKKLQTYAEQNKPLEDYYKKQKKLLEYQVAAAPGETWRGLLAALHLQHMNAHYSSSQKLTAKFC